MSEKVIRPFVMNFKDFIDCKFLNVFDRVVIESLKYFAKPNFKGSKISKCTPSIATIAEKSKVSESTVHRVLKRLKAKGIIKVFSRFMPNKSQTSNEYILYDFSELWNCEDENKIPELIAELEEKEKKERLTALQNPKDKPTTTKEHIEPTPAEDIQTKEKEIENIAPPTKESNKKSISYHKKISNFSYNNAKEVNCQDKKDEVVREIYSMDSLRLYFEYEAILNDNPTRYAEIDSIFNIIYDVVNYSTGAIRVNGNSIPADVVVSKIMKLDIFDIQYVVEKYCNQYNKIYNHKAYVTSILYNAKEQHCLDIKNQVNYDLVNTDWAELKAKQQAQQEQEQTAVQEQAEQEQDTPKGSSLYELLQKVKGHKRE